MPSVYSCFKSLRTVKKDGDNAEDELRKARDMIAGSKGLLEGELRVLVCSDKQLAIIGKLQGFAGTILYKGTTEGARKEYLDKHQGAVMQRMP